ncbi:hypothetical protein FS837_002874 [Tulasnella sp. UAMH 9824]|nr:hypothetical protein FS837_002874 [Tulasnella sp. UAMH 9824]
MSPIPRVHRQALEALLSTLLFALTLLLQTIHTSSKSAAVAGIFVLPSLLTFAIATYVVETAFCLSFAFVQVYWCTILVDLFTSACAQIQIAVAELFKTVDLVVELKSGPFEKGRLIPQGDLSSGPPEWLDRSFISSTADETLLKAVVAPSARATVPNIVFSEDAQDSARYSSHSPSSTSIVASIAHFTSPTFQNTSLVPHSNSTPDLDSDVEWEAADDPAGFTSLFLTPPQASISRSSSTLPSSAFSNSASTLHTLHTLATTPRSTSLDLQSDLEREINAGNPSSTPDITAEIELPKSDPQNVNQVTAEHEEEVHIMDHQRAELDGRTNFFGFDEQEEVTENDHRWKRVKREGKVAEGGRRPWARSDLELPLPTSMSTSAHLVAPQAEDDHLDDEGYTNADFEKAILMSLGLPVDPTPSYGTNPGTITDLRGRSFTPRAVAESRQGAASGFTHPPEDSRPVSPSVSTASTLVETDDE